MADRKGKTIHVPIDEPSDAGLGTMQIYTIAKDDQSTAAAATTTDANAPRNANDNFYDLWDKFYKPSSSKVCTGPLDVHSQGKSNDTSSMNNDGAISKNNAQTSFDKAAETCRAKVDAIVKECKRLNRKYCDRNFDFEDGFAALEYLGAPNYPTSILQFSGIGDVKRVDDIFDEPRFMDDGATGINIRQGGTGSCWFLAALTALGGTEELEQSKRLLSKVCVTRNEQVGVYGFVFYRDGEWVSEVVDDRLPLKTRENLTMSLAAYRKDQMYMNKKCDVITLQKLPQEVQDSLAKGSDALYFSSCTESQETWLSLIEKAYAKVHGNYQSIDSGYPGEGIEDLTGGVNTTIDTNDILDKDQLWNELLQVNKAFLFGCSSRPGAVEDSSDEKDGIVTSHAYTVMGAREIETEVKGKMQRVKLVKVRNPWGYREWTGAWADGSKEWTPEAMKELNHRFGDDGIFWIPYKDFLKYFPSIDRTRLFGPEWTVSSQWTSVNVPWDARYLNTKFTVEVEKAGPVVIVLCQPDDRFFKGLTGRHKFYLHYRLYKDGEDPYLVRSMSISGSSRSCSAELDLEAGSYSVHMKIEVEREAAAKTTEEVIKQFRLTHTEMVMAAGKRFDVAHSKGLLREMEKSNTERTKREKKQLARRLDIENQKLRRTRKSEERRREKAKKKRIANEIKRRKAEKKAAKAAAAKDKVEENPEPDETPPPAEESRRSSSAGILTPETTPPASTTASQKDAADSGNTDKVPEEEKLLEGDKQNKPEETDKAEDTAPKENETCEIKVNPSEDKTENVSSNKTAVEAGPSAETKSGTKDETTVHVVDKPEEESKPEATEVKEIKEGLTDLPENQEEVAIGDSSKDIQPAVQADETVAPPAPVTSTVKDTPPVVGSSEEDDDDIGSVKDEDFEWDSDIDGPVEKDDAVVDETDDMLANDPWNAVCVVGLRVHSLDPNTKIGVVVESTEGDA